MRRLLLIGATILVPTLLLSRPAAIKSVDREAIYAPINSEAFPAPQERGDIIPDFSRVGYRWGDKQIPNIKVMKSLKPPKKGGDATQMIQEAIDGVESGAILLTAGTYYVNSTINLNKSGVVLRGVGSEEGKPMTKIVATGEEKYNIVKLAGSSRRYINQSTAVQITDDYVPCGQFWVGVDDVSGFKVGDAVVIQRPSTQEWISDIRMDQIVPRATNNNTIQWEAGKYDLISERVITLIEGNRIHFENPVIMGIDTKYGGGSVAKYSYKDRVEECGIEGIYFESCYNKDVEDDESHGWNAIQITSAQHCWVRDVRSKYFGMGAVTIDRFTKNITVANCVCEQPISKITGGRRYSFHLQQAELCLIIDCRSDNARHDFVTGMLGSGPNAFVNGVATNVHADIGPHHRWNVGTLYDNIVTDGEINSQDRGYYGTGHGWAGANQVFWNCEAAKGYAIQNPWASAYNYSVGNIGKKREGSFKTPLRPYGVWVSHNEHVSPKSLYEAQLESRRKLQPKGVMDVPR